MPLRSQATNRPQKRGKSNNVILRNMKASRCSWIITLTLRVADSFIVEMVLNKDSYSPNNSTRWPNDPTDDAILVLV